MSAILPPRDEADNVCHVEIVRAFRGVFRGGDLLSRIFARIDR